MYVRAKCDCDGITHAMRGGRVYDVNDTVGQHLLRTAKAEPATADEYLEQVKAAAKKPADKKTARTKVAAETR